MNWDLIPIADAVAFRDHIAAREQARLIDLARAVRDTGGPLEFLDGSRDSIAPLWVWFAAQSRAGFPGIPDRKSALEEFWHLELDPVDRLSRYAVEPIAHYLALVCRGYFEDFDWALWPSGPKRSYRVQQDQSTILRSGDHIADPIDLTWSLANVHFHLDEASRLNPERLLLVFDNWFEVGSVPKFPLNALTPYADLPPVPLDDPVRVPPRLSALPSPDNTPVSEVSGVALVLSRGEMNDLGALSEVPPLDEELVARYFTHGNFERADQVPMDVEGLGAESIQLVQRDGHAQAETIVAAGRLRGISLEPLNVSSADWSHMQDAFRQLAASLQADIAEEA